MLLLYKMNNKLVLRNLGGEYGLSLCGATPRKSWVAPLTSAVGFSLCGATRRKSWVAPLTSAVENFWVGNLKVNGFYPTITCFLIQTHYRLIILEGIKYLRRDKKACQWCINYLCIGAKNSFMTKSWIVKDMTQSHGTKTEMIMECMIGEKRFTRHGRENKVQHRFSRNIKYGNLQDRLLLQMIPYLVPVSKSSCCSKL